MKSIIDFLTNILHKIGLWSPDEPVDSPSVQEPEPEPHRGKITTEPLLAMEDGYLVLVVDHTFADVPSWVEWDPDRQMASIAQMDGGVDELRMAIKREYLETLLAARKLLLVSNDNEEKIMHYVPFLARK